MEHKKKLNYCKKEYIELIENCGFTQRQKEIFTLRREGLDIYEISIYDEKGEDGKQRFRYLPTSESTVKRELKEIRRLIQEYVYVNF